MATLKILMEMKLIELSSAIILLKFILLKIIVTMSSPGKINCKIQCMLNVIHDLIIVRTSLEIKKGRNK